ncbi:NAD(P)/FAD-dependent oxidoreductase [Gulosibacter macacae]|uniref:Pyridine nucleotide-disulfide oxidoreductase domain-containing protein 2 n=1 Tax=Gulosibacter macacae TaxID=2488791 RepID=A0A3P3VYA7_9MICO|nr:NAD(P)/FAD-dependent oxidoreductase [Gulosibacter macacae]RRJ87028.1 NAD(P)/FAD-dependent oxidoreductase [Gulosibacter macacae]
MTADQPQDAPDSISPKSPSPTTQRAVAQPERSRAVVVGAGPNGLTAAALLARAGWQVDVYERAARPGGAAASAPVFGPDTIVDLGAAAHPFGAASPVFHELELERYGLEWCRAEFPLAHPFDDRPAALLHHSLAETAAQFDQDASAWQRVHAPLVRRLDRHLENLLAPMLRWPAHPVDLARIVPAALPSATALARVAFRDDAARAFLLGSAAHAMAPLTQPMTAAFGTLFGALGQTSGWPVAIGGSGAITDALARALEAHGGRLHLGHEVRDLRELPPATASVLSLTPRQVLALTRDGDALPPATARRLRGWRHGSAAYKVDFLLDGPVPWRDARVGQASTVHVIGTPAELVRAEAEVASRRLPAHPMVIVCQQQAADPSRASNRTIIWAYAHVPFGYRDAHPGEVRGRIEAQIERFAPGFRDRILEYCESSPAALEAWNPNLVGGDIAGGAMTGRQVLFRPGFTLAPHRLAPGLYLASASTPPGAGVHGMPGAWAARTALADAARRAG